MILTTKTQKQKWNIISTKLITNKTHVAVVTAWNVRNRWSSLSPVRREKQNMWNHDGMAVWLYDSMVV